MKVRKRVRAGPQAELGLGQRGQSPSGLRTAPAAPALPVGYPAAGPSLPEDCTTDTITTRA